MNKTTTILLALLIGLCSFSLAKKPPEQLINSPINNKIQFLQAGTYRQVPMNIVNERIKARVRGTDNDLVPLDKVNQAQNSHGSVRDDLWDLTHVDDYAEWYLGSGDAGDTMAVAFTPAAPCIVKEVYHQWFDGGNVVAFGAMLSDIADDFTPNGASTNFPRGMAPWSPIGELMTPPTPNTIEDYVDDWSLLLDIGIIGDEFMIGDSTDISVVETFLIVIIKGGEGPHPLASDVPGHTYLWFGGPWTNPDGDMSTDDGDWGDGWAWGSYQSSESMDQGLIDNMILVKVEYPWGAPLAIQSMNQLNNTYDLGHFMPPPPGNTLTVYADLFDDVGENGMAIDGNDDVVAHYSFQGNTTDLALTAHDVGADGNGIWTFEIFYSMASPGDSIEYWITATDNDGLMTESMHMTFHIKAPVNPDADLLVIRDRVSDSQRDLVEQVLDDNGFVYEVWDTFLENGIDASVISHGWSSIIAYGWGNNTIPVIANDPNGDDPGYGEFIDNGGNLLLIDMDWFFGHNLPSEEWMTFSPGDFAYDYFGIAAGLNDWGTMDTVEVTGEGVTAIDNPFTETPLTLRHGIYIDSEDMGWIDYLTAGDGTPIFYDHLGNLIGIAKDHDPGGQAVYLSFMADAAGDTSEHGDWIYTQFAELIDGALAEFGIASPPVINLVGEGSTRYGVASGTSSATVNASGFDSDGELTSVVLKYSVDEGDEIMVNMVAGEGTLHSVIFDIEGFSDASAVTYWAEATDNDGFTTSSGMGTFWGTSFVGSGAPVLYMRDHYEPYDTYGPAAADSVLRANMESAGIEYDTWVVWDNSSADYATVLSNYTSVIYAGVYDWTPIPYTTADNSLSEFVAGGGYMLFSSEEVLGTLTDWNDLSFGPGEFVYDVLGVEWVGNDYNYTEVAVGDDGGTGLINGLPTEDIALNADIDDFGSMADLCDPLYYDTPDVLSAPFNADYTGENDYYYASSINGNVAFTAFNISMLPDAEQQSLLTNFSNWVNDAGTTVSVTVDNISGWNLVGLPAGVDDNSYLSVYPEAVSGTLYEFSGSYVNVDALTPGNGYWLNFPESGSTTVTGSPIQSVTVSLSAGWNLISGISETVDVASISDPGGIIVAGTVYGFSGSYANASELTPGQGYWVNSNADGDITISSGSAAKTISSFTDRTKEANTLSFNGNDLYFGVSIPEEEMLSYQLPPKPLAGAFDVRFADNLKVAESEGAIEIMNNTNILTIAYTVNINAGENLRWVLTSDEGKEYELNGSGEILVNGDITGFTLNKVPGIPLAYSISQNYPNPFNPVTSINYEIPKESFVTISVYNLMGQKVADLVSNLHPAGYHNVMWNSINMSGKSVSSGVYIYTIQADDFRAVKKMVFMK